MNTRTWLLSIMLLVGLSQSGHAAVESYLPTKDVAKFVSEQLDVTSFRSSFGPRRAPGKHTFKDYGIEPSLLEPAAVELKDGPDWWYRIDILERRDVNGDGFEDLVLCFTDKAVKGSYYTRKAILVTR